MHDRPQSIPPSPPDLLNLSRYTEQVRRQLWDTIALDHFAPHALQSPPGDSEDFFEVRTAEEAGLRVEYFLGRWFALWWLADPPPNPTERERWELVSLSVSTDGALTMAEV